MLWWARPEFDASFNFPNYGWQVFASHIPQRSFEVGVGGFWLLLASRVSRSHCRSEPIPPSALPHLVSAVQGSVNTTCFQIDALKVLGKLLISQTLLMRPGVMIQQR